MTTKRELTPEELEQQGLTELPAREAMSLVNPAPGTDGGLLVGDATGGTTVSPSPGSDLDMPPNPEPPKPYPMPEPEPEPYPYPVQTQ